MKVTAPDEGSSVEHARRAVSPDTRLGTIHAGNRYVLGFGPDSYGIWDEFAKGAPVERFPATDAGRNSAWQRYTELEPGATDAHQAYVAAGRPVLEETGGRKRWPIVVIALVIVAGAIIGLIVANSGGNGEQAGPAVDVGKEAHIDVSGGMTLSEDLPLTEFKASGTQAVFGGVVDATWKGPTAELRIELHSPTTGKQSTSQIIFRAVFLSISPAGGTPFQVESSHGECSVTVETLSDSAFAGEFECTGLPTSGETIDVKGTFAGGS